MIEREVRPEEGKRIAKRQLKDAGEVLITIWRFLLWIQIFVYPVGPHAKTIFFVYLPIGLLGLALVLLARFGWGLVKSEDA